MSSRLCADMTYVLLTSLPVQPIRQLPKRNLMATGWLNSTRISQHRHKQLLVESQ